MSGRRFNGLDNLRQMWADPFYWNALGNMVWYVLAIVVEYAMAFGLALLLHSQIRRAKFFRVAFLLPLMLSPVAVSWMIGKSMLENRFGP
jgi:multiple sugar transport system permease protein